jgi:cytochrome c556
MSRITLITTSVAIVLGLAALVNVARAADPTPPAPRTAGFERMGRMCGDMDARLAAHLAYSEAKLKLTGTQKVEFLQLSETMKEASAPMRKLCDDKVDPGKVSTLPERMGRMQQVAEARAEALRKMVPAMSAFYASLTLEQQKVADDLMSGKGGFGRGGHGRGMMHH